MNDKYATDHIHKMLLFDEQIYRQSAGNFY